MTLTAFDIGMVKNYNEPKYLLHFQWKKFNLEKLEHVRIPKKTSIGRRPKMSSMNKHKKRSFKRYNSQGK
jgi:hypothetical protein